MSFDFAMEKKLAAENPELHGIFRSNVVCCQNMLVKYKSVFPSYTDHTSLHSLEIISFCNELVGEYVGQLNCDEIFVLLMAAYLHDSGMGISESDFEQFAPKIGEASDYIKEHPDDIISEVVRRFHHEFSGRFVEKYAFLFDFPSDEHLFAVKQICRGHRKTNLFDENEYPAELKLENGNIIHLPYLAALVRLGDELDIAADRNIQFLFDFDAMEKTASRLEFKKHKAIKNVKFAEDCFDVTVEYEDEELYEGLVELFGKLQYTLDNCVKVVDERTPFRIKQRKLVIHGLNI